MSIIQMMYKALKLASPTIPFIAFSILVACANPSIKTTGNPMVMSLMAGEWKGEYSSETSGKSGIIEFNLTNGTNNAHGQVFMKEMLGPNLSQKPLVTTYFRPLEIKFVHAGAEMIHGKVDPYKDLKRNITIHTSFKGKLIDDVMEGTYSSTVEETNQSYKGKWKVTRQE